MSKPAPTGKPPQPSRDGAVEWRHFDTYQAYYKDCALFVRFDGIGWSWRVSRTHYPDASGAAETLEEAQQQAEAGALELSQAAEPKCRKCKRRERYQAGLCRGCYLSG